MLICWNAKGVHGKRKVGNPWARAIVPPVEQSVSWHDAIRMKRSVCHAIGMLLVA